MRTCKKMILILKYTNVIIMMKIILADLNLQSVSAHMKHAEMHEISWSWNGKHIILLALIVELLNKKIPFYVIKIIIQKSSFVMLHWHWKWGPGFCVKYKNLIVITDLHHSITNTCDLTTANMSPFPVTITDDNDVSLLSLCLQIVSVQSEG